MMFKTILICILNSGGKTHIFVRVSAKTSFFGDGGGGSANNRDFFIDAFPKHDSGYLDYYNNIFSLSRQTQG